MTGDPPYPADLEAKGWSLDLDYEQIEQSDTWAIATAEQRPWLLMLWLVSWRQVPVASLPQDDRLIAARIGLPVAKFTAWRGVLLSGWEAASDGRLYHKTLTQRALRMAEKRVKDRDRVAAFRAKSPRVEASNALHTRDQHVSSTPLPTPTLPKKQDQKTAPKGDDFLSGVDLQVAADFKALRTKLRAPITKTAMDGIRREADKAGITFASAIALCCENSWRGFKASWINNSPRGQVNGTHRESVADRAARLADEGDERDRRNGLLP